MKRNVIAFGLIASSLAGGAAFAQPVIPPASEPAPYGAPAPEWRRPVIPAAPEAAPYGAPTVEWRRRDENRRDENRWTYLAATQVNGRRDRDIIALDPDAGRFDKLMLVPQGERVRVHYVIVRFANGETITQDLRDRARGYGGADGAGSIVIDLPGDRRAVASVELYAGNRGRWGGGNGQVALYGERGEWRGRGHIYR